MRPLSKDGPRDDLGVEVICADGSHYEAKQVIITVPLPCVERIAFTPAIPEKIQASKAIGYGAVIKVLMRFTTRWWAGARQQNFEKLFFMFSDEAIPTWWTQYPESHATLTGWLAGPRAEALKDRSDGEIIELSLQSLSNTFRISIEELKRKLILSKVLNWPDDPHALCAYSYPTPETASAVKELLKPIDKKLLFAGEALSPGNIAGTVEAALISGKQAAKNILAETG